MTLKVGLIMHDMFKQKTLEALRHPSLNKLEIYPRWYSHEDESIDLTKELNHQVDMVLYGGPVPYYIAKKKAPMLVPGNYVIYDEVSLMKAIFDLQKMNIDVTRLSVDTLPSSLVREVYDELQLDNTRIIIKALSEDRVKDDYTSFHIENYQSGKTSFAITCRSIVYQQLTVENIPCYYMNATKASIVNTLNKMVTKYQWCKFQDAQLAIGLIKVKAPETTHETFLHSRRHQIEIQQYLLHYAEKLKAGLTELGDGLFLFYTTLGVLKKTTKSFQEFPEVEQLKNENIPLSIGIGTGDSASEAEERARKALLKAEKQGDNFGFILLDGYEMIGPFGRSTNHSIIRTESLQLQELSKDLGVTSITLGKLYRLLREEQRFNFSAEELAHEIGLSSRSARRILNQLNERGLADLVGEEMAAAQGRPRRIYRIKINPYETG